MSNHNAQSGLASHVHVTPVRMLVVNLIVLTALMVLTIAAAQIHIPTPGNEHSPVMNNLVAMGIAVTKAFLVVWIFMGVKFGTKLIKLWAYAGFIWFGMLFFVYCDYYTRSWEPVPGWTGHESALPRSPLPETVPSEGPKQPEL